MKEKTKKVIESIIKRLPNTRILLAISSAIIIGLIIYIAALFLSTN